MFWALFARNVKPDLDPKLFLVDTSRWRVDRLLHFCGILLALTMYTLNGFFLPIRCIYLGMVHYIHVYRGVTAYNCQIKLHFFLCASLFHTCSKQCRPWWNASFRLGLHSWFGRRDTFMSNQYKWFINYCSKKKIAEQLSPKIVPFIYFHNVCMREVESHICGGSILRGSPLR